MKYTKKFNRDIEFYIRIRNYFNFDGSSCYVNNSGEDVIQYYVNGACFKQSFFLWDSQGCILKTKHPTALKTLLKTKASINLHIKMYAEDRANGTLPLIEFIELCKEFNPPLWFYEAVERQKNKLLFWVDKSILEKTLKNNLEFIKENCSFELWKRY